MAALVLALMAALPLSSQVYAKSRLGEFLARLQPTEIDPDANAFGALEGDPAVAPLQKNGTLVGYAFLNADVVDATGYSGKPINIVVGLDLKGRITGAKVVEHHEPIVPVGISESKVVHFIDGYNGRNVLDTEADSATPVPFATGRMPLRRITAECSPFGTNGTNDTGNGKRLAGALREAHVLISGAGRRRVAVVSESFVTLRSTPPLSDQLPGGADAPEHRRTLGVFIGPSPARRANFRH